MVNDPWLDMVHRYCYGCFVAKGRCAWLMGENSLWLMMATGPCLVANGSLLVLTRLSLWIHDAIVVFMFGNKWLA